jgi:hypothetical protein
MFGRTAGGMSSSRSLAPLVGGPNGRSGVVGRPPVAACSLAPGLLD